MRLDNRLLGIIEYEWERLQSFRTRPVLADPLTLVDRKSEEILQLVSQGASLAELRVERATAEVAQLQGHLRGLSPQSTLERGYSIARKPDGSVVSKTDQVSSNDELQVIVSDGVISTRVEKT